MTPKILPLPKITDPRGNLSFLENGGQIPFNIQSVSWQYDIPGGTTLDTITRQGEEVFLIALSGSFDVVIKDTHLFMHRPDCGLLIPGSTQYSLKNISTNSVAVTVKSGGGNHYTQSPIERDFKKKASVYDCNIITLDKHTGNRLSTVTSVVNQCEIPFDVKRLYYVYDVPSGESRGGHAHKSLYQLLFAVSGSFTVTLDDGHTRRTVMLNRPNQGLLITPGIWRTLEDFAAGSVCMVLASEKYDENDYIRKYEQFRSLSLPS